MNRHAIHLRDPWIESPTEGGVLHRRRFHTPTGLTAEDEVWLVIVGQPLPAQVLCNRTACGTFVGSGEFNITGLLDPYNELEIRVSQDDKHREERSLGKVRLEIRGPAS
jgi:hypothetical protein